MAWVVDGSGLLKISETGSLICEISSRRVEQVAGMWKQDGVSLGESKYFEMRAVRLKACSPWFGISTEKFFVGCYPKGLYLGGPGNTSDGLALVKSLFIPRGFEEGDVVGMKVDAGDELIVSFYLNSKFMGNAFQLAVYPREDKFFPTVMMDTQKGETVAEFDVRVVDEAPPAIFDKTETEEGILGRWIPAPPHSDKMPVMTISKNPRGQFRIAIKCANVLSALLEISGSSATAGPVAMTMMLPPPEWQEIERKMSSLLSMLTSIVVNDEGGLTLGTSRGTGSEWIREPKKEPMPAKKVSIFN